MENSIKDYLSNKGESHRVKLNLSDFALNQSVKIDFEDESFAEFKYAFTLALPTLNEVGVFTEHCGYHIFNSRGLKITDCNVLR